MIPKERKREIGLAILAAFEKTGLEPCRAVVRTNQKACVDGVIEAAHGEHLGDFFGIDSSAAAGIIAGFCGRAVTRYHSESYRDAHPLGRALARKVFGEGPAA